VATYVLIHGASSDAWYWHQVVPRLRARGHDVVAPDLPSDDDSAGWSEYAATVVGAVGDRTDLTLVAQSLGGFTAPLVCQQVPVDLLVLVAAMVPLPGESASAWWDHTGYREAQQEQAARGWRRPDDPFDAMTMFFHDVPPEITAEAMARGERAQSATPFGKPCPFRAWPPVPTRFLLCKEDRFFPAPFMRRVVKERLGITPDEMDAGHLPALGHPEELVERLEAHRMSGSPRR